MIDHVNGVVGLDGTRFRHRMILAAGIRFHFVAGGAGPAVILLAGFPQSWYAWAELCQSWRAATALLLFGPVIQAAEAIAATYLSEASAAQLRDFRGQLRSAHAALKAAGRELNLTRGKPATEQVALSDGLLTAVTGRADCLAEDGTDCTNYYGSPQGLIETRRL